jgi:hypothetical protein
MYNPTPKHIKEAYDKILKPEIKGQDKLQSKKGQISEANHTYNKDIARRIGSQHLAEDKDYYKFLEIMESKEFKDFIYFAIKAMANEGPLSQEAIDELLHEDEEIKKSENVSEVDKVSKGIMLYYPVTIMGDTLRPDNQKIYHATIKQFDYDKVDLKPLKALASSTHFKLPDPKSIQIIPSIIQDRFGEDTYVLELRGEGAHCISEAHEKFFHFNASHPVHFEPHITLDKATWQKIMLSGHRTAWDACIMFKPVELRDGDKVICSYDKKTDMKKYEIAVDEWLKKNDLEKGEIAHKLKALGLALAIGMGSGVANASSSNPSSIKAPVQHERQVPITKPKIGQNKSKLSNFPNVSHNESDEFQRDAKKLKHIRESKADLAKHPFGQKKAPVTKQIKGK